MASHAPRPGPWSWMAATAYSLHVGQNLQDPASHGRTNPW